MALVDQKVEQGVPVTRACDIVGLSRDTYYGRKRKGESVAAELPRSSTEANDTIQSHSSTASPNAEGIGSSEA